MSGLVGIKIPQYSPIAKCVSVIRKLEPDMAISEISTRMKNDDYVLTYGYTDDEGIKKIIKCYDGLVAFGIIPKVYEHDRDCGIDFIRNLNNTYDEIGDEIEAEMEEEFADDKIFEYRLFDAWMFPLVSLSVYEREEENVKCLVWYATGAPKDLTLTKNYTLDGSVIEQIRNVIGSNRKVFGIEEIESEVVLDGFVSSFFFRHEEETVQLQADNIWVYREGSEAKAGKTPPNAKLLLSLYDGIKSILAENGVDSRYLALEW